MQFCVSCGNMYYLRLIEENSDSLVYYCRKCGHEENVVTEDNMCVSRIDLTHQGHDFSHLINKYTKLDPTLPRTKNIKCPNSECPSNKDSEAERQERDILYIRYNDTDMKYVYLCALCDRVWTLEN